ncbi:hypothetical protein SUDANB121_03513 [Nocardiopsis dassonvillei]|uniref:sensor domain-containing protein n=1 Tax=Nocardiopsis dassonvillei TaxID=2014 RepID=UPI003F57C53C
MDAHSRPSPSTTLNGGLRPGPSHPSPSTTLNGGLRPGPSHPSPSTTLNGGLRPGPSHPSPSTTLNGGLRPGPSHPSPSTTLNGGLRPGPSHPSPSTALDATAPGGGPERGALPPSAPYPYSAPLPREGREARPRSAVARLLADTRHALLGLPLAVVSFSLVLAGLAAGLGSAVAGVGLFILVGTLYAARGIAHVDRVRIADLTGAPVLRAPYREPAPGAGPVRRALAPLGCGRSWLDALHALVRFPVSLVAFVVTVTWWTGAPAGLLYPLWGWSLYTIPGYTDVGSLLSSEHPLVATTLVYMAAGALFLATLVPVVRACAQAEALLGRALLLLPEDPRVRVYTAPAPRDPGGA